MHETIIYEAHVRGLTITHPGVPATSRGTYAGVAHPAVIDHLTRLGVTAIELMPVHQFVHDHHLTERGLRNYWGYNSIAYLAPHNGYAVRGGAGSITEFKAMVKALHAAGIEVILDVVYNHTAEGNHLGPTLSMRGVDNHAYYRLIDDDPRQYLDFTGTGNSLNARNPHVLQLIMDSLRYWVTEMHVDGFRFDLASTLARELYAVDRLSAFFDLVQQDPVVSQVKLIAEPWDVGEGGYQVGNFPPMWSEWNGRYRDTIRDFWRGEPAALAEFGFRFTGSSDLYQDDSRRPTASINFVTAHDGFTLADLVSYNEKHNEANGEGNRDGESHNRSWNCGVEGPTDDATVLALRQRQRRNLMTTLLLSQGVPMILGGDELGRTQAGNNNAYCQDGPLSWFDWEGADEEFLAWCQALIRLRRAHPVFRRRRWFQRHPIRDTTEIVWLRPDGQSMSDNDWENGYAKAVGVLLDGDAISTPDRFGGRVIDDTFYVMLNASELDLPWTLPSKLRPAARHGEPWVGATGHVAHERGGIRGARRRHPHRAPTIDRRSPLPGYRDRGWPLLGGRLVARIGARLSAARELFDVCVVGSSNLDLVVTAPRHPAPGETLLGTAYNEYPGGKGLNQVVAATRAGAAAAFVSALGDDAAGDRLAAVVADEGIDASAVQRLAGTATGRALITVDAAGENSIVVVPGANAELRPAPLPGARVVLSQLEIPIGVVTDAFTQARAVGGVTILNPAPATALPDELLSRCTIVIPNQHEHEQLGGADRLFGLGVEAVITTLGSAGVDVETPGRPSSRRPLHSHTDRHHWCRRRVLRLVRRGDRRGRRRPRGRSIRSRRWGDRDARDSVRCRPCRGAPRSKRCSPPDLSTPQSMRRSCWRKRAARST